MALFCRACCVVSLFTLRIQLIAQLYNVRPVPPPLLFSGSPLVKICDWGKGLELHLCVL